VQTVEESDRQNERRTDEESYMLTEFTDEPSTGLKEMAVSGFRSDGKYYLLSRLLSTILFQTNAFPRFIEDEAFTSRPSSFYAPLEHAHVNPTMDEVKSSWYSD
jgi:hypothetical protein